MSYVLKMSYFENMFCPAVCIFSSPSFLQSNSAESVAMGLLRQFEGMQLPAASELDWLVPEHDAPQKVQHLVVSRMAVFHTCCSTYNHLKT